MKRVRKTWAITIIVFVVLVLVLKVFAGHPFIVHNDDVPENYFAAIQGQAKGFYSSRIPLVPVLVSIDHVERDTVFYTIYYFPFGTVEMTYASGDGYNIEKPLTRW